MTITENIIEVKEYKSLSKTIDIMRDLENDSIINPIFINFMRSNFEYLKQQNDLNKIIEIKKWINRNINYKDDVYDETLISPKILIYSKNGDCDDFALLLKTMLNYLNVKVNYILLAKEKNKYTHIANSYILNKKILYIDALINNFDFPEGYKFYKII